MLYGFGAMPSSFSGDPAAPAPKACPPGQVGYPPYCFPNPFAPKPAAAAPGCQPGFTNQGGVCLPEYLEKRPAPEKEANYTPWILASVALAATAVYFAKSKESS